jgi:cell division septum initiation protein DivIVA
MEWDDIERARVQGFTVARRGYDQREVDKFLAGLLEWLETEAPKELGGMAVKRKLERAGKSTAQILLTTEQEAEQMRRHTEQECEELHAQADVESATVRRAAEEHAKKVREKADEDARRTAEAASARAKRVVEEGERRRAQIEAVIGELENRRDGTLDELQRLRDELAPTIEKHKPGARSRGRNGGTGAEPTQAERAERIASARQAGPL